MTPKQRLKEHIATSHGKLIPKHWTLKEIQRWHAHEHHQFVTNHVHAGPNRGPDQRPPGWLTGEDAIALFTHLGWTAPPERPE